MVVSVLLTAEITALDSTVDGIVSAELVSINSEEISEAIIDTKVVLVTCRAVEDSVISLAEVAELDDVISVEVISKETDEVIEVISAAVDRVDSSDCVTVSNDVDDHTKDDVATVVSSIDTNAEDEENSSVL